MKRWFKFWLVGIFALLGLSSFCSAKCTGNIVWLHECQAWPAYCTNIKNLCCTWWGTFELSWLPSLFGMICYNWNNTVNLNSSTYYSWGILTIPSDCNEFSIYNSTSEPVNVLITRACQECQECQECEVCQSCPEIDTNYCVENDLCPVPSNYSLLYINQKNHYYQYKSN